jgi:serine/threonine protein kinase
MSSLAGTFGITKDLTSSYMIVMKYYENGNLYQYLDHCNGILSWRDMIDMLWGIAGGLERIHSERKIYGNLHGGNYLSKIKNCLQMLVLLMLVCMDHVIMMKIGVKYMGFCHILRRKFCLSEILSYLDFFLLVNAFL